MPPDTPDPDIPARDTADVTIPYTNTNTGGELTITHPVPKHDLDLPAAEGMLRQALCTNVQLLLQKETGTVLCKLHGHHVNGDATRLARQVRQALTATTLRQYLATEPEAQHAPATKNGTEKTLVPEMSS